MKQLSMKIACSLCVYSLLSSTAFGLDKKTNFSRNETASIVSDAFTKREALTEIDSISSWGDSGRETTTLLNFDLTKPYINRQCLEIRPTNYMILHQSVRDDFLHRGLFERWEETVTLYWKSSLTFSNAPLVSLLEHLVSIRKFKIVIEWDKATDGTISNFIEHSIQHYTNLEELDLSGCCLTDNALEGIVASISRKTNLKKLDVRKNPLLTAESSDVIYDRFSSVTLKFQADFLEGITQKSSGGISPMPTNDIRGNCKILETKGH